MRLLTLLLLCAALAWPQARREQEKDPPRMPNGRLQIEAILKAEHQKSLEDTAELIKTAEELKMELEKNDRFVLSLSSLKKLDVIEKLTKRLRSRIKR